MMSEEFEIRLKRLEDNFVELQRYLIQAQEHLIVTRQMLLKLATGRDPDVITD